jgi:phosphohistidine swiveling domain-containing protein
MAATVNTMETWEGNLASLTPLGRPAFDMLAVGGKAASLHRIKAAGFPVPAGFVVTPDTALDQPGELQDAVSSIGGYPVAVRSSALLEDLAGATFAGQYSTHLSITDPAGLVTAIAECRASQHTQHVVSYLKKNGCEHGRARISVLVQKMVDAAAAGVAFSIHPHTGREEHALIECCRGLGDRLVSGNTTPTQYTMRLEDAFVLERRAGNEDVVLPDETLRRLCRYALELQAFFGMPQDIEWAMDRSGELWILQSRPITRIHWRCEADDFTNANFRDGGVGARVITPLMYSLYGAALQSALQQYFVAVKTVPHDAPPQAWISKFYGRPYWNASAVKRALSKVPGYDEERFDRDLGIQKDYGDSGPIRTPLNLRTLLAAVPVAIALKKEFRRQLRLAGEYRQNFSPQEAKYLRLADSCAAMTDGEFFPLLLEVLDFHKQTERDYLRTVVNHVNYQAEFNKLLARIQAATGEAMKPVVLMSGLQDVSHMTIQSDFVKLVHTAKVYGSDSAEWDSALADFLSANFFHGDAELDISAPRWRERPERIKETVDSVLRSKIDPKDVEVTAYQQFLKYSEEVSRVIALLQRTLLNRLRFEKAFRERLQTARTYALRREELREYAMRADNLVRRYALEAGRRLCGQGWTRQEEDAFMLSAEELQGIVQRRENRPRILAVTDVRRLMHRGYALVQPPGELGRAILHRDPTCDAPAVSVDDLLKGNGCSAGVVTGRARVVTELAACNALQPNEVLVTRFIDPSWTPVIGLVSGLVAEVGGLLSHGAVIAREYGLPAVLDVRGATCVIKTGQMVEIDGTGGTVRILSTESAASTAAGSRDTGNPACAAPFSPAGNAEVNLP